VKREILFYLLILNVGISNALTIANPAAAVPEASVIIGAGYDIGGYTITNDRVPCMMNRFMARAEFAPVSFLGFGLDAGTIQMDVEKSIQHGYTIILYHGNYGFSGGAHLKLSSPFILNTIAFVGIGSGTIFSTRNTAGAEYGGKDAVGAVGIQLHIKNFGFITVGPQLYYMQGQNKSFTGETGVYSNVNNLRGWMAIDFFPKINGISENKSYISFEFTASPDITVSKRIPVQEYSISISIGTVTKRLYGIESAVDWEP
jgi:hypothetical protein